MWIERIKRPSPFYDPTDLRYWRFLMWRMDNLREVEGVPRKYTPDA